MSIATHGQRAVKFCQFLVLASIFMTSFSWANGTRDGGGGNGIIVVDKPYLLDLFEYGVHLKPLYDDSIPTKPSLAKRVKAALLEINPEIRTLVAQKLSEIYSYNRIIAVSLLKGMEMYTWRLIDANLTDIEDDDGSDVDIDRHSLVQLAIRSSHTIRISKPRFDQLDSKNAAALVFHEVIYAMLPPQKIRVSADRENTFQVSRRAREITGYLFSPYFKSKGPEGFSELIADDLPKLDYAQWKSDGTTRAILLARDHTFSLIHHIDADGAVTITGGQYGISPVDYYSTAEMSKYICELPTDSVNRQNKMRIYGVMVDPYTLEFANYDKSERIKQMFIHVNAQTHLVDMMFKAKIPSIEVDVSDYGTPDCISNLKTKLETAFKKLGYDPELQ